MPLRYVTEAFVRGQSFHSAHSSVQFIILYPRDNETFGFPSPPMRWFLCLPEWLISSLRIFSLQISNFFSHIGNCISLHVTRQRLRLCTCLEIQMKNRSKYFLSLYPYKCVQGCTWKLICPIHPCLGRGMMLLMYPVLSSETPLCCLLISLDETETHPHHITWEQKWPACAHSCCLSLPAVQRVICRGRREIKLAYRNEYLIVSANTQILQNLKEAESWRQDWVLNGVHVPDLGGRSMKLSPSNNVVSHDGVKSVTPPSPPSTDGAVCSDHCDCTLHNPFYCNTG